MEKIYLNIIIASLYLSFFIVAAAIVGFIVYQIFRLCRKDKSQNKKGIRRYIPGLIAVVVFAIFTSRLALELYICTTDPNNRLTVLESIVKSTLHTLLVVGTYEEFTEYIIIGKQMIMDLFGSKAWVMFYDIHTSLLTVAAPLLGYAVVLDVLTKVFPKIKYYLVIHKKRFYFSELNERSLALAESIANEKFNWFDRPLLVFTDTYIDDEEEKSAELLIRAKNIGALCLSDDILHLNGFTCRDKYFFLIDNEEIKNIDTLAELSSDKHFKRLKRAFIYVFYQNASYEFTENKIINRLEKNIKKQYSDKISKLAKKIEKKIQKDIERIKKNDVLSENKRKEREEALLKRIPENEALDAFLPVIKRVRYYENLVFSLLEDIPLVTPVVNVSLFCDREREFNLTIFGNGEIGTQMLLSSTWCGQFYGYKLCINVISTDDKEEAIGKINRVNPDILETSKIKSDILKIFSDDKDQEYSDPYFTFRYAKEDVQKADIASIVTEDPFDKDNKHKIIDSDYFFVALGSDETNIAVAEQLRKKILIDQLNNNKPKKAVIVMVVFNPYIRKLFESQENNLDSNVRIEAFGSLDEAYSWQNVTMNRLNPYARQLNATYRRMSIAQARHDNRERRANSYNYWSTVARRVHYKYRVFSAYQYMNAEKKKENKNEKTAEWQYNIETYRAYNEMVKDGEKAVKENVGSCGTNVYAYLTWLEHRRWNAYLRSIGYTLRKDKGAKNIDLKLHSCLVECKKEPVAIYHEHNRNRLDLLDEVGDYKIYDRPGHETEYIGEKEAAEKLGISKRQLHKMCKNGDIPDAIKLDDNSEWLIPSDFAEN